MLLPVRYLLDLISYGKYIYGAEIYIQLVVYSETLKIRQKFYYHKVHIMAIQFLRTEDWYRMHVRTIPSGAAHMAIG